MIIKSAQFLMTKLFGVILAFFASWYLSRVGGAELWGRFSIGLAILNLMSVFLLMGLDTLTVKLVSGHANHDRLARRLFSRITATLGSVVLMFAVAVSAAVSLVKARFLSSEFQSELLFVVALIPGFVFLKLISAYYRARGSLTVHGLFENVFLYLALVPILQLQ